MGVVRSAQSLSIIRQAAETENGDLILTSFQLRKGQKDMIEALAKRSGESQATVVRTIIDEWIEMRLRD